jgi:hypothetical protein
LSNPVSSGENVLLQAACSLFVIHFALAEESSALPEYLEGTSFVIEVEWAALV